MEALKIVRENMLDPDQDWIIDAYTLFCFLSHCQCKEMGYSIIGDGICPRCEEIEYVDKDRLEWQMLCNAIRCLCRM